MMFSKQQLWVLTNDKGINECINQGKGGKYIITQMSSKVLENIIVTIIACLVRLEETRNQTHRG